MHFGLDGKLYAAHGDNANGDNAQTLGNLLGKIIRMNPVADPTAQIPTDNPFCWNGDWKESAHLGPRAPQSVHVQHPAGHGPDVRERRRGEHVGRNRRRARRPRTSDGRRPKGRSTLRALARSRIPSTAISTTSATPTGCAITGGAFYNPPSPTFPASYIGKYFFADYCSDWIYYINPASPGGATPFAFSISAPVDLKIGPDAALYYLARGAGSVGKIQFAALSRPTGLRIVR